MQETVITVLQKVHVTYVTCSSIALTTLQVVARRQQVNCNWHGSIRIVFLIALATEIIIPNKQVSPKLVRKIALSYLHIHNTIAILSQAAQ